MLVLVVLRFGTASEIADAARIDGAGAFRALWSVMKGLAEGALRG